MQLAPEISTEAVARPRSAESGRLHLDFLDGLRALAALAVVLDHAYLVVWARQSPPGALRLLGSTFLLGHFAVSVFILLSGFCLMLPVVRAGGELKGGARLFFKKRARRILPPYYLSMGLCLLLIYTLIGQPTGSHWDTSIAVDRTGIWTHLLLVHNLFPHSTFQIDSPLWSVAVECQIYLLFPLLVLLWRRWGAERATAAALALGYALFLMVHHTTFWCLTPSFLGLFALGALAAGIAYGPADRYAWLRERAPTTAIALLLLAGCAAAIWRIGWQVSERHLVFVDPFVALAAACLLISAARSPESRIRRALAWRPLALVGTFSYSLYLVHVPLQQLLWQYFIHPWLLPDAYTFAALLVVGTPAVLGLAFLFFLVCERPFLNTRRQQSVVSRQSAEGARSETLSQIGAAAPD